ncbi:MAG: hypothetical protein LBG05_02465 [Treponema sp.]|jgi:hypothetical protein|nr:hypothetical protein [Treponema sp.]
MQEEEFQSGKIYCANCFHCKLLPGSEGGILRIRCTAGKWKKKLEQEKVYRLCTIMRRFRDECEYYEDMGESTEFIRELRKSTNNEDSSTKSS